MRGDAGLRVGKAFLRCAKIVRVLLIMLHNEVPHVIGQGHASRLRGCGELRLYRFPDVKRYHDALPEYGKTAACKCAERFFFGSRTDAGFNRYFEKDTYYRIA
jgi:hypothetical protein